MQACGSACLAAQLKRESDLGSTPGIPGIFPARRLFERRTKQASVGFKSKGYAVLGIQFNAITTQ